MKRGEEEEEDNSPKEHESASVQDAFIITALYFFFIRSNYLEWGGWGMCIYPAARKKRLSLKTDEGRTNKRKKK